MSLILGALLASAAPPAHADAQGIIVVTAPGGPLDADEAQSIDAADIRRTGAPDLIGSLSRSIPGVSLSEAQSNPYQPNLVYRGFTASPLQGNAQGLAVYLDGARFNQPFGDTVNFDLLPDAAIRSVTIRDANPVYGLNALGGVATIETKTGRSAPGGSASVLGGDYGRTEAEGEFGMARGRFSAYFAAQVRHDDGWRRHSPSDLLNFYADLGWDGEGAGVHLKLVGADTDLTGNGPAPVQLLAADRRAVFTYPDRTQDRYGRLSLHPWIALSDVTRVEGSLYLQHLRQRSINGDLADIAPCEDMPAHLCLDDDAPVTDRAGAVLASSPDVSLYGLLNRSLTRSTSGGVLVQLNDSRPLLGGTNRLVVGFSYDRSRTGFQSSSELGALTPDRAVTGLGPVIAQADGTIAPVSLTSNTAYTGLFLDDTLPLTSRLKAELGLRWNDARIELRDRIGTALNGRHGFRRLNLGAQLEYEASEAFRPRIGYAESNRAPTPAELSCADEIAPCSLSNFFLADPPLKQVTARNWEAGASGQFGTAWRVDWQVSAYRTDSDNDIQFVASEIRGRAFFRNIGRTRRQGVEINAAARRGPWALRAGYAFTDATFQTPFALNSPDNPGADAEGRIAVRSEDRLPSVPRHRATFSADYEITRFSIGADLQLQSGQMLLGDEANLQPPTRGFALLGAHGTVRLSEGLSLFAAVRNLLNAHYATFGTFAETAAIPLAEAPGAADPRSLSPGAPRRWTIGGRLLF